MIAAIVELLAYMAGVRDQNAPYRRWCRGGGA